VNASTEISAGIGAALGIGALLYLVERHREDEEAAQQVAAAQAKNMEELRQRDVAMVRERGFDPVAGMIIHRARPAILPFQQVATAARALITRGQESLERIRRQMFHDGEWHIGFIVVVAILGTGWLFLFYLLRNLDISVMRAVGYPAGLSNLLGSVSALAVSFLGIVISGLLGIHTFLPRIDGMRRSLRTTIALLLLVPVMALVGVFSTLAPYRSQSTLGPQVSFYQKTLQELENTAPRDPVEIAVTKDDLAAAEHRLDKGKTMDRTLAVTIPLAELLLSPAAVYGAELLVALELLRRISVARRKEEVANHQEQAATQNVLTYLVGIAVETGYTPGDVERLLLLPEPPGDLPPAGAGGGVTDEPSTDQGTDGPEPGPGEQEGPVVNDPPVGAEPGDQSDPPSPPQEPPPPRDVGPDPFDLT
jgi:hypothetical protein